MRAFSAALKWVRLDKRKPRHGQRCLLFIKETGHIMAGYYYPNFIGGFSEGRNSGHCIPGVHEWMPWPK